jgi:predicted CDP-diglyceride synthetase/phosphatidate cytidylyltransferase
MTCNIYEYMVGELKKFKNLYFSGVILSGEKVTKHSVLKSPEEGFLRTAQKHVFGWMLASLASSLIPYAAV